MLVFAHAGISLGIVYATQRLTKRKTHCSPGKAHDTNTDDTLARRSEMQPKKQRQWLDYRWLLLGSILPDIIDKPLGTWIFNDTISNGRIFLHTLLFLLIISVSGIILHTSKRNLALASVSAGWFLHLCLDEMWRYQQTLFWPLYGIGFSRMDTGHWLQNIWVALFSDPRVFIPEIIGVLCLSALSFRVSKRKQVLYFIKTGQID